VTLIASPAQNWFLNAENDSSGNVTYFHEDPVIIDVDNLAVWKHGADQLLL
jgi:hypothetical protein